jgi:nanoRNase/pAp phosphatase (c-di-AMP/oligoRNAs hydrolase)
VKRYAAIFKFFESHKDELSRLLIVTHDFPDPDALASAFALHHLAQDEFGIPSRIAYGGFIARTENKSMVRTLRIPVHKVTAGDFKKYEHVALVDTQLGFKNNSLPLDKIPALVIDQHASLQKPQAGLAIIDPQAGATSTILARTLLATGKPIPTRVATAIVYGIITDTQNLFRVTSNEVIKTYTAVIPYCNLRELAAIQLPTHPANFFKILGRAIENTELYGRLIVIHLGEIDNPDLISQFAEFLLTFRKATIAFCTGRFKGNLRMSLRTENVNEQAGQMLRKIVNDPREAGGHGTIGGGAIKLGVNLTSVDWQKLEQALSDRLRKLLRIRLAKPPVYPFRD